jgi:putative MFS transporter
LGDWPISSGAVPSCDCLLDALFGLLSAFVPSFAWLLFLRFLTGLAVGGTLPVDYAMMSEFLPAAREVVGW